MYALLLATFILAAPPGDFAPRYGDRETFTARYVVDPLRGGKDLQAVMLLRDDGEAWLRAYRPIPDEYRFIDRLVVVTGRPYWPSPHVQAVGGTHVDVEKIDLAPGEAPHPGPYDLMPAPPEAADLPSLAKRAKLWVRAVGRLAEVTPGKERYDPSTAVLELADGHRVAVLAISPGDVEAWKALAGQPVTITGRVKPAEKPEALALWGRVAACPGVAPRCGMEDPRRAPKQR